MNTKIQVKYIDTNKYIVDVYQDDWTDNPTSWGTFKLHDFTRYGDADINDYLTDDGKVKPAIQSKIRAGKMWWVDKYDHSVVVWSLTGEGMNCRWDTSPRAGLLELDDDVIKGVSKTERERYARGYLATYNQWLNGDVWTATIRTDTGLEIDSLSGLYGLDGVNDYIAETLPDTPSENIEIKEFNQ